MNGLSLEYLADQITETLNRSVTATNDAFSQGKDSELRVRLLTENIGDLRGHLAFLKDQMNKETERKRSKKFYQFWK